MRSRYPPGPSDPLFGLRLARRLRKEPLEFAVEMARQYGDLASFCLGPYRVYVVNHPDYVHQVLVTQAKCFRKLPRVMRVLSQTDGNGLVISEGDFWLRQRRLAQPAFHAHALDRYAPALVTSTRRLLDQWPDGAEIEIAQAMGHLILEILSRTLFDVELASDQVAAACEAISTLSEVLVQEMGQPLRLPGWLSLPGLRRKRQAIRLLDNLLGGLIRERRAAGPGHGDLLSRLLWHRDAGDIGRALTDRQARDEAMTLLHAGLETTAAGLAWVWYLVAKHPEVEARLVQEVDAILGERPATSQDVPLLCYTGMVVKESLRLYVPTWILFPRQALREVEVGGYVFPRGSWVIIFPYALHRDPRWFAEPERFDPERFAPGRWERVPPCAYLPFGAGPHLCLGRTFALTAMTLIVATVLQQFRLGLARGQGDPEAEPFLALRPRGGVRLTVARRSARQA
jgi:cytochrome P450